MSLQSLKYAAYNSVTPGFVREQYKEHGREIANAESFARLLMVPYLFYTAASGKKGALPGMTRVAKMLMDGHDGYASHLDKDFLTAEPTVHSAFEMTKRAFSIATATKIDVKERACAAVQLLHDTNGKKVDPDFDKAAQFADQIGGVINGDVSPGFLMTNILRTAWIDAGVRPAYANLGVVAGSTLVSQGKTLAHDIQQAAESFGILDRYPQARSWLSNIGIGMTIWSAFDIMTVNERAYLDSVNYASETVDLPQILVNSIGRTAMYLKGAEIPTQPLL